MRLCVLLLIPCVACIATLPAAPTGTTGATAASLSTCGGSIVDPTTHAVNAAEYKKQALAADRATIDCRLGPAWAAAHAGAADDRPTAYLPPLHNEPTLHNGAGGQWNVGGPYDHTPPASYTFGSEAGQTMYVPDADDNPGVDRLMTYEWGDNVIEEQPQLPWNGIFMHASGPNTDPSVDKDAQNNKRDLWTQALGQPLTAPFTLARSTQTWSNDAIMVWKPGLLGASGTQTSADTHPHFVFPANKVPMAIAVTSQNEFTLVAVWDTDTQKSQLAVLANLALGLLPYHTWPYFGLPNAGSYTAFKLMGYVDLPFATPTAIAAANNVASIVPGANGGGWIPLDTQASRDTVFKATDPVVASAGYVVIASRWENKLAFIDMQPLYALMIDHYLTTQAKFDTAKTQDPDAWPFTFAAFPTAVPTVLTVLDVQDPRVVLAGARRYVDTVFAHVALADGTILTYDVATLANAAVAQAADVKVLAQVQGDPNPTAMGWPRNFDPLEKTSSPYEFNGVFLVLSRSERQLSWVVTTATTSKIFRRFKDSRMQDPVDFDVDERAYVMVVADFGGKQVITYRFDKTPDDHNKPNHSFGMGADGTAAVECGGTMPVLGWPFRVSQTNVN